MAPVPVPLEIRYWAKVDKRGPDECWPWVAYRHGAGYGRINRGPAKAGQVFAHRVSWEIHYGSIPDGLYVLHRCDNPPCQNPAHLFVGTTADNMRDKVAKGRQPFRWTRESIIEGMRSVGEEKGRVPQERDFLLTTDSRPGYAAIRHTFGKFSYAIEAAGYPTWQPTTLTPYIGVRRHGPSWRGEVIIKKRLYRKSGFATPEQARDWRLRVEADVGNGRLDA